LYVPATPGVAVTVAGVPAHTVGLLTVTVGSGLTETTPEAATLTQPVTVFVKITEYVPEVLVVNEATLPGFVTPPGTVHA
jgi:hypothetical protein